MKTSEIAKIVNLHPNTIRLYEEWGLIAPVPRQKNGYRVYSETHLDQVLLVRMILHCTVIGGNVSHTGYSIIKATVNGQLETAITLTNQLQQLIKIEQAQAEATINYLEAWAQQKIPLRSVDNLNISQAAKLLDITPDMLRDWERNGLISVPRAKNGYRIYNTKEINELRVIRMLRRARYSNMAILRVIQQLNSEERLQLRQLLDTPTPDPDQHYICATDRWISTLTEALEYTEKILNHLHKMSVV